MSKYKYCIKVPQWRNKIRKYSWNGLRKDYKRHITAGKTEFKRHSNNFLFLQLWHEWCTLVGFKDVQLISMVWQSHFQPRKYPTFLPFPLGIINCPGEILAKLELFLFLSRLLCDFQTEKAETEPLLSLGGMIGIIYHPSLLMSNSNQEIHVFELECDDLIHLNLIFFFYNP